MTQCSKGRSGSKASVLRAAAPQPSHFKPHGLVRALAACSMVSFWTGGPQAQAQALPTGMNPVAGQVTARTNGNALTVTNSPNAIINWKSFSIGAQNSVRFDQANASSQVLNRVTGKDPSAILGSLSSNGRVWLLNQNGVLFGQGARIDVAGLVASTLNISDTDWLTGRYQLASSSAKAADVINQGELRSSLGGQIALLGGSVRNEGLIAAPGGQVLLAAGSSVELLDSATPNVSVKISSTPGEVVNLGRLSAAGGRVDIHAGIVNQDGIVRADALERGPAGEVVMRASANLNLAAGSVTAADGGSGGKLALEGDQNRITGQVSALGADGKGGQIKLLGREVGLIGAARIDASGRSGGGEVLVGGGLQGRDPSVPNAQAVYFGPNASISANAIESGDGGRVILWSDKATRAFGSLNARGGATGGDGGFIETSGGWLDARPLKVDTSAPFGKPGMWLLDPYDITISDTGTDSGFDRDYTANADDATILTSTLNSALASGTQVVVSTGGAAGTQAGDITMDSASISVNAGFGASLSLIADGNITINGSGIRSTGNPMPITLRAGRAGTGAINIESSDVVSAGGDILLGGYAAASGPFGTAITDAAVSGAPSGAGVRVSNSTLDAAGGGIDIRGIGQGTSGSGVSIGNSTILGLDVFVKGSAIATGGTGVEILSSNLEAGRQLWVDGRGDIGGVTISDGGTSNSPQVWVLPSGPSSLDLSIQGESSASSGTGIYGVNIDVTVSGAPQATIANYGGFGVFIDGNTSASAGTAIRIAEAYVTSNVGPLQVGQLTANTYGAVELDGARLEATSSQAIRIAGQYGVGLNNGTVENGGPITVSSNRETTITNSTLSTAIAGAPLTVESVEKISVVNSALLTNGGDILLAGPFVTAALTPAVATGFGIGVTVDSSTIDAQGGNLSIWGRSEATGVGAGGAAVTQSSLSGANIQLFGDTGATAGSTGVSLQESALLATQSIDVRGVGGDRGVHIFGSNFVEDSVDLPMLEVSPIGSGNLSIYGEGLRPDSIGVDIDTTLASGVVPIVASGGAAIEIYGQSPATAIRIVDDNTFFQPTIEMTGGGSLTIGDARASTIRIDGTWMTSEGAITLTATNAFVLDNAAMIESIGPASVFTQNLQTIGDSFISSSDDGLGAIVLSGVDGNPMDTWASTADSLDAPAGRWLAYLTDVTNTGAYPTTTGLNYDFKLYGVAPGDPATDSYAGNGLVFAQAQVARSQAIVLSKVYDGNTDANTSNFSLTLDVPADVVSSSAIVISFFIDKNAGTNKQVTEGVSAFSVVDQNGKPVYGYILQEDLRGDIAPATLSYVATRTVASAGSAPPALSGTIIGFAGSDTATNSTDGTVVWTSTVTSPFPPGVYAINGAGLNASNYIFVQDPTNATALSLAPTSVPPPLTAPTQTTTVSVNQAVQAVTETPKITSAAPGGLLDLTAVSSRTTATSSGGGANSRGGGGGGGFPLTVGSAQNELFESIDVSGQSQEVLAQVLADRDRYKKALFAEALDKLEKDPGLADQKPCLTLRDVERGSCLVTEALKREWLASEQSAAKAAISAAPADAVPASTPSPAPAKTTLAQAEPEQRASPVPGEAATGMSAAEAVALGVTKRRVKEAALPQIDRKVALVIGVDNYDDPSIPRLSNAVKDARAVGRLLEAQLGYETIVLNNPGKTTVIAALNRLALTLQPSDSVVVYYAGHGEVVEATKLGYWQLADADAKRPETWLSNSDIGKLVTQLGASQVALVSDSCYSGSLVSDERIRATAGTVDPAQVLARRAVVVMSSGGNEPVFDAGKNGHSPFAFSLMNSLGDLTSWQAGGNVFERVRFAVSRELPQRPRYGANVAAGHSSGGDYLFERRQLESSTQ